MCSDVPTDSPGRRQCQGAGPGTIGPPTVPYYAEICARVNVRFQQEALFSAGGQTLLAGMVIDGRAAPMASEALFARAREADRRVAEGRLLSGQT